MDPLGIALAGQPRFATEIGIRSNPLGHASRRPDGPFSTSRIRVRAMSTWRRTSPHLVFRPPIRCCTTSWSTVDSPMPLCRLRCASRLNPPSRAGA